MNIKYFTLLLMATISIAYGWNPKDVKKLAETGECINCDFTSITLDIMKKALESARKKSTENKRPINLESSNFSGADLSAPYTYQGQEPLNLSESNLEEANFSNSKLVNVIFRSTNLKESTFNNADVSLANFTQANLMLSKLENIKAWGARFNKANLSFANFTKADLEGAHLNAAYLDHTILYKAKLWPVYLHTIFIRGKEYDNLNQIHEILHNMVNTKHPKVEVIIW